MITLTDGATNFMSGQLDSRGHGIGIRLAVRTAGCSGLAYVIEFLDERQEGDTIFEQGDFIVAVDPKSYLSLRGMTVDHVNEGLNSGLQFINPNVKNACGCGESFHV
jgi:iron-sulfur cluster assembly protein